MKRVKAACLYQTLHFLPKEDLDHAMAVETVQAEVAHYKAHLERNQTAYKIDEETKKAVPITDDSSYTTGALTIKATNSIAIQSDDNIWIGSTGQAGYLFINETATKSEDFIRMQ